MVADRRRRRAPPPWAALERVGEPALTPIGVFTMDVPRRVAAARRRRPLRGRRSSTAGRCWPASPGGGAERRAAHRREPPVARDGDSRSSAASDDRDRRARSTPRPRSPWPLYSFVAALGFARVFGDWQFVGDVARHRDRRPRPVVRCCAALPRARRRSPSAITAVALGWTIAWLAYPTTFAAIFPTRETWDIAWADLGLVRDQFQHGRRPGRVRRRLVAAGRRSARRSSCCTADTFAFRARARGEALVPGAVLFVFVAALGADRHRVALTLALVAAGFLAAALLRVRFAQPPRTVLGRPRQPAVDRPAGGRRGRRRRRARRLGHRARACPGADAEPLVDTHNDAAAASPRSLSPLVDIRSRLVNRRRHRAVRRARPTPPAYWRVSGLPEFDGRTWSLPERALDDVGGELVEPPRPGRPRTARRSTIAALRGELVPAAAEPVAASTATGCGGTPRRRRSSASTATCETRRPLRRSCRRCRASRAEVLRAATSTSPPDPIYLELPDDFPASVSDDRRRGHRRRADDVRRHAGAAELVPDRVRVQPRRARRATATSAIEAFLRQRIGYCEQFAGTFAAMARSLGVPARVAVGFTPGRRPGRRHAARCSARTPTPGRRSGSTASAGCRSSRRPGAARRAPRTTPGVAPAQDESVPPPGAPGDGAGDPGDGPQRAGDGDADHPALGPADGPDRPGGTTVSRSMPTGCRRTRARRGLVVLAIAAVLGAAVALPDGRAPVAPPPSERRRRPADRRPVASGRSARSRRPGCRVDPGADPARAGPGGGAAAAGRGPAAEVAGRGGHGGDLRAARRGRVADRPDARRRARTAPVVPPGRAHRRRLDDDRRPHPPLLHGLAVAPRAGRR